MHRLELLQSHLTAPQTIPKHKRGVHVHTTSDAENPHHTPAPEPQCGAPQTIPKHKRGVRVHTTSVAGNPHHTPAPEPLDVGERVSQLLPGPIATKGWRGAFAEYLAAVDLGEAHVKESEWCREYGGSMTSNIVVPQRFFWREGDEGKIHRGDKCEVIIVAHPADAERLAQTHIKKAPNFTQTLSGSIISTTDNDRWKTQRSHLTPAFLPQASLASVYPISEARARHCVDRLRQISARGRVPVDMSNFLLHEALAQLQLAMLGESEEHMEMTNKILRDAFSGRIAPQNMFQILKGFLGHFGRPNLSCPYPGANTVMPAPSSCPVKGPLARQLGTMTAAALGESNTIKTQFGNAFLFLFAGHDTTGHTMTWLIFEMAKERNRHFQLRLQNEVDRLFARLNKEGRHMAYTDLHSLPFMSRCITEILRLWPAVANGTFRQLQKNDVVTGPNGQMVPLKKGTFFQVTNWGRHRSPELWGADAAFFNPDREFRDAEIWNGRVFAAYNPATARYSPFTFPPRDCIGKNFAQMEARTILAHLFHNFHFDLADEFKNHDPSTYLGVNYGTLAPQDLSRADTVKTFDPMRETRRPTGLKVTVTPRNRRVRSSM